MALRHNQTSFAWGEFDPLLAGRTDIEQYSMAVAKAYNAMPLPQGGIGRAPGLEYLATVGASGTAKMFPFDFSDEETYVVIVHEDGNIYMYDVNGVLIDTIAHPYTEAQIPYITIALNVGEIYLLHAEVQPRVIRYTPATSTFDISTVTFSNIPEYPFLDSNATLYPGVDHIERIGITDLTTGSKFTLVVDGHETEPITFDSASVANTITNVVNAIEALSNVDVNNVTGADGGTGSGTVQDINLTMSSNNGSRYWAFEPGKVIVDTGVGAAIIETSVDTKGEPIQEPVWGDGAYATATLTLAGNAANGETVTIQSKVYTFQTVLTNVDGNVLIGATASDSIDNLIAAINLAAGGGTLYAAATTLHPTFSAAAGAGDTMVITAKSKGVTANSAATTETMGSGSWGAATASGGLEQRGWPRCGAFYKGRLWLAGSLSLPNFVWGSRSGDYENFDTEDVLDDMGFAISISGPELTVIHGMSINRHLQLFGASAEYYIPEDTDGVITPTNVSIRRTTQRGSKPGVPILNVDGATYFIDKSGRFMREFLFAEAEQAYVSTNLQQLSGHLVESADSMAYRRAQSSTEPDQVFVVDRDTTAPQFGSLKIFNTLRDQNIAGWSRRYTYRGQTGEYGLGASGFYDVCVVNGTVFVLTLREVAATDYMYLEKFSEDLDLDCAKTGGAGATATGLAHLNSGVNLVHVVDNNYQGAATVSGGSCTLGATAVTKWQVGFDFPEIEDAPLYDDDAYQRVWVQTLPVPAAFQDGGALGRKRKTTTVAVRLHETSHLKVNGKELIRRAAEGSALDDPMPTVTGVRKMDGIVMEQTRGDEYEGRLNFTQNIPLPMTILSIEQSVEFE